MEKGKQKVVSKLKAMLVADHPDATTLSRAVNNMGALLLARGGKGKLDGRACPFLRRAPLKGREANAGAPTLTT